MIALRIHDRLAEIDAAQWNALHASDNPFVRHAFLDGLERQACLRPQWGWTPHHLALWDGDALVAAAPAYLKTNSHGEFVFDYAWATAYEQHGRAYYPKLLIGVPYTPVTGPRLLARNDADRAALLAAIGDYTARAGLSSAHINFLDDDQNNACGDAWLERCDVQFHWRNPADHHGSRWHGFDDFLDALQPRKRKNIRQERARVRRAGVGFHIVHGADASDDDLAAMHAFYCMTFADKGNSPTLTLAFLRHLATEMPDALVLILAQRGGQTIAGALCLRGGGTLYGRYWGSSESLPGLHFETCYYQGIEYCLRHGLHRFEPGAQGEHKIARGFLPVLTHSRHHLPEPQFQAAIGRWCAQERVAVQRYRLTVLQHSPYRADAFDAVADHPA